MEKTVQRRKLRLYKRYRFPLIHAWMRNNFEPCKVADVGGGKGMLAYLLQQDGWDTEVIDPKYQSLLGKYKTLDKERKRIENVNCVKRRTMKFSSEIVKDFDWIVGIHLHGANMEVIRSCAEHDKDFFLVPCCVIDEPVEKKPNVNWGRSLSEYAGSLGFDVKTVQFNFKGKNIGIYTDKHLKRKKNPDEELNKQILIEGEWNNSLRVIPACLESDT